MSYSFERPQRDELPTSTITQAEVDRLMRHQCPTSVYQSGFVLATPVAVPADKTPALTALRGERARYVHTIDSAQEAINRLSAETLKQRDRINAAKAALRDIDRAIALIEPADAQTSGRHWSSCAVHNEPAMPAGQCDCGADAP